MIESDLVRKILVRLNGGSKAYYWKIHQDQYQEKGISDILGVDDGAFIAMEVKLIKHKDFPFNHIPDVLEYLDPAQILYLQKVAKCGGEAHIVIGWLHHGTQLVWKDIPVNELVINYQFT